MLQVKKQMGIRGIHPVAKPEGGPLRESFTREVPGVGISSLHHSPIATPWDNCDVGVFRKPVSLKIVSYRS